MIQELEKFGISKNEAKIYLLLLKRGSSKVNEIYDAIISEKLTGIKESSLMPFLGKSKIKEMFNKLVNEAKDFDDEVEDEEDEE